MHRDWVFQQLLRIQNEKHPSLSWMQKYVPPCRFVRQTAEKCYRAADAEGIEMRSAALYDLNGEFYRLELPVHAPELSIVSSGSHSNANSSSIPSSTNSNSSGKKRLCRIFKKTGNCRFGDTCRFEHVVSAGTPAAAADLPAAVAIKDPDEDQMGIDLEEFTCGADLGPGCTGFFKTCPSSWIELGKKHNKDFVTPTACRYCRKLKKEFRNGHTNAKIDSNARPVRHVISRAMTAAGPENTTQPTDDESWFVDTPVLTIDWLSVDMLEAPIAQSQSSSPYFNTNPNAHDCCRSSNHRQAR